MIIGRKTADPRPKRQGATPMAEVTVGLLTITLANETGNWLHNTGNIYRENIEPCNWVIRCKDVAHRAKRSDIWDPGRLSLVSLYEVPLSLECQYKDTFTSFLM